MKTNREDRKQWLKALSYCPEDGGVVAAHTGFCSVGDVNRLIDDVDETLKLLERARAQLPGLLGDKIAAFLKEPNG